MIFIWLFHKLVNGAYIWTDILFNISIAIFGKHQNYLMRKGVKRYRTSFKILIEDVSKRSINKQRI